MFSHSCWRPRWALRVASVAILAALAGCGGAKSQGIQYKIQATVSGLAGTGLVLRVNGGRDIAVGAVGPMDLAYLASGSDYSVTVAAQPSNPAQTCTVSNASGKIAQSDVTDVVVACSADTFSVSVKVTGLAGTGTGLALLDTNNDTTANAGIPISRDGTYAITPVLADNAPYWITIASGKQPTNPWQTCNVENGKGATHGANVTVNVTCVTNKYAVKGTVSGLVGTGLKLSNGGTVLSIDSASSVNGSIPFSFSGVDSGSSYAITIAPGNQPIAPPQLCTVVNGTGTVLGTDVAGIQVTCQTLHRISGKVSGTAPFDPTGIKVSLGGDKVASASLDSGGNYTFDGLADGHYTVGVPFVAGWSPTKARIPVNMQQADFGQQDFSYVPAWEWSNPLPGGTSHWGVWGSGKKDVWSIGNFGTVRHWDGTSWTTWTTGTTNNLFAVWGSDAYNAWAVGDAGTILHWDGTSWNLQSSGTTTPLNAIWGTSSSDVWAAGNGGAILRWNGTSWGKMTSGNTSLITSTIRGVWGVNSSDVWAAGDGLLAHWNGTVWSASYVGSAAVVRSIFGTATGDVWAVGDSLILRWKGTSWISTNTGAENLQLYGVWAAGLDDVWAVGIGEELLHWTGSSWTNQPSGIHVHYWAVWGSSSDDVWAVGLSGSAVHWSEGAWSPISSGSNSAPLVGIWGSSATDIWTTGLWATLYHGQDQGNGMSWAYQPLQSIGATSLSGIWGSASNSIWAVGEAGTILFYNGTSWVQQAVSVPTGTSPFTTPLWSVWGSAADNEAWAVGSDGAILHLKNGTWSPETQTFTSLPLWRVWGTSINDVWAVGSGAVVLHRKSGTWVRESAPTDGITDLLGLWGVVEGSAENVWAVGRDGAILHYVASTGGSSFTKETSNTTQFLKSVWGSAANDVWAVGEGGTILHWNGNGWSPTPSGTNDDLRDVWGAKIDNLWNVWAVGYCGDILHWNH